MIHRTLSLLALSLFVTAASAQCDGRYVWEIFSDVDVTADVHYGYAENYDATFRDLHFDFYEPQGDTETARPLVLMAHGGFFVTGDKDAEDMIAICTDLAQRGYACASIQYRLGVALTEIDSAGFAKAVIRAVQDAKAAVRYLRANATTYGIDTSQIFFGGTSAGGVLAAHLAYMQPGSLLPNWVTTLITELGGLEGDSGTPGESSRIHGVVSYAGAIKSTDWMGPRDVPMMSIHGDADDVVPFGYGWVIYHLGLLQFPITPMNGSELIHQELDARGVHNRFFPYPGVGHVVHVDADNDFELHAERYPETVHETADFLHTLLHCYDPAAGIADGPRASEVTARPTPASGMAWVALPTSEPVRVSLTTLDGRTVRVWNAPSGAELVVEQRELPAGFYALQAVDGHGGSWAARVQFD